MEHGGSLSYSRDAHACVSPELRELCLHSHTHFFKARLILSPIDVPSELSACLAHRL
jgi:hypothetical protein